jgi:hypothetical protein
MTMDIDEPQLDYRETLDRIARDLPDHVIKESLRYLDRKFVHALIVSSRSYHNIAFAALYSSIVIRTRAGLNRFIACWPDPAPVAGYIEQLAVPSALTSPAREYVERLLSLASNLHTLKFGLRETLDANVPFAMQVAGKKRTRKLIVGTHFSRGEKAENEPFVPFSLLDGFENVECLHWDLVDTRAGTLQHILRECGRYCPNVKEIRVPWTNKFEDSEWDLLPIPPRLEQFGFRFEHEPVINMPNLVGIIRSIYQQGIIIRLGSNCGSETQGWNGHLLKEIWSQRAKFADVSAFYRYLIYYNRSILWDLTSLDSNELRAAIYAAFAQLDLTRGRHLMLHSVLTVNDLPSPLLVGVRFLRLAVNQARIPATHIPDIIRANPRLESLNIAVHINISRAIAGCTQSPTPLVPGQIVPPLAPSRNSLHRAQQTPILPAYELIMSLDKAADGSIRKRWRKERGQWSGELSTVHDIRFTYGPEPRVESAPELWINAWPEDHLSRLQTWEGEVMSWFSLSANLSKIVVVLNSLPSKIGKWENYWCSCSDRPPVVTSS